MEFKHTSVLLDEVLENLAIRPGGIYVDGTLGGGGHSYHILERLTWSGRLIGIDQDTDAIAAAAERLAQFGDKVTIVHDNYEHMAEVLDGLSVRTVDGILLDLGVSSYQLDNPERGFSYRTDAPLDMRMDRSGSLTAREIVNTYSQEELTRILRERGEDRGEYRQGTREDPAGDDRRPEQDHKGVDPRQDEGERGQPRQEDLPGDTDRLQQGTGCPQGFPGQHDRSPESRRKAVCDHLSLARGQDRQERVQEK